MSIHPHSPSLFPSSRHPSLPPLFLLTLRYLCFDFQIYKTYKIDTIFEKSKLHEVNLIHYPIVDGGMTPPLSPLSFLFLILFLSNYISRNTRITRACFAISERYFKYLKRWKQCCPALSWWLGTHRYSLRLSPTSFPPRLLLIHLTSTSPLLSLSSFLVHHLPLSSLSFLLPLSPLPSLSPPSSLPLPSLSPIPLSPLLPSLSPIPLPLPLPPLSLLLLPLPSSLLISPIFCCRLTCWLCD